MSDNNVDKDITDNNSNDKTDNRSEGLNNGCDENQLRGLTKIIIYLIINFYFIFNLENEVISENNKENESTRDYTFESLSNQVNSNDNLDDGHTCSEQLIGINRNEENIASDVKKKSDTDVSDGDIKISIISEKVGREVDNNLNDNNVDKDINYNKTKGDKIEDSLESDSDAKVSDWDSDDNTIIESLSNHDNNNINNLGDEQLIGINRNEENIVTDVEEDSDTDVSDWNSDNNTTDSDTDDDVDRRKRRLRCTFPDCNKLLPSKCSLITHMDIHSDKTYECDYDGCHTKCNTRDSLYKHKKKHSGKYRCTYQGCTFVGTANSHLIRHQISHSDERSVKCEECHQYFKES